MPLLQGGGGLVTGSNIVDGSIADADVAVGAAVQSSKINFGTGLTNSQINENLVQYAEVSISSAEILQLHATPKTLVAAPGVGKLIIVENITWEYIHVSTAYLLGDDIYPVYAGDSVSLQLTNRYLVTYLRAAASNVSTTETKDLGVLTTGTNKAITAIVNGGTAYTTGNGTLKAFIKYRTITL
jgi:hypothetical protein